jgi:hypothetical protein
MTPRTSTGWKLAVVIAIAIIAALVGWWAHWGATHKQTAHTLRPNTLATKTAADRLQHSLSHRSGPSSVPSSNLAISLPPQGTKVVDVLAALRDAADHGDTRAACRVGIDLGRCWHVRESARLFRSMYDRSVATNAPADDVARNLEYIKVSAQMHATDKALCEGVSEADADES